jgi:hypothetical protein
MNYFARLMIVLLMASALTIPAFATSYDDPAQIMQTPAVRAALDSAKADEPNTIETQIHICEIAAPPSKNRNARRSLRGYFAKQNCKTCGSTQQEMCWATELAAPYIRAW